MPSSLQRLGRYLKTLVTNVYFWGGLVLLGVLALVAYFLFDSVLMPQYTRYGVSVTVPDVAGVQETAARERLEARDLEPETIEETYNPAVARGAIIEQNPDGGRSVKPGRRVYLTVNSGDRPMVSVPDVVDASLRDAKNRIQSLGLQVGEVREDAIPSPYANTVTRQQPAAGDSLPRGTAVSLWYSTGLSNEQAPVPDVTGMTIGEARQALRDRRLRTVVLPAPEEEGAADEEEVMRQSPAPETEVREGSEVRLFTEEQSGEGRSQP